MFESKIPKPAAKQIRRTEVSEEYQKANEDYREVVADVRKDLSKSILQALRTLVNGATEESTNRMLIRVRALTGDSARLLASLGVEEGAIIAPRNHREGGGELAGLGLINGGYDPDTGDELDRETMGVKLLEKFGAGYMQTAQAKAPTRLQTVLKELALAKEAGADEAVITYLNQEVAKAMEADRALPMAAPTSLRQVAQDLFSKQELGDAGGDYGGTYSNGMPVVSGGEL